MSDEVLSSEKRREVEDAAERAFHRIGPDGARRQDVIENDLVALGLTGQEVMRGVEIWHDTTNRLEAKP